MTDSQITTPTQPTVIHLPGWHKDNPYQLLLANGISTAGWRVEFANYPDKRFPLTHLAGLRPDVKALHIHWITPYIKHLFWSRSYTWFTIKALLLSLDVLLARIKGKRVIWTVHNRVSHETPDASRELYVRRLLARTVSALIFHSAGAREEFSNLLGGDFAHKSTVIPHGNYIGTYPQNTIREAQLATQFAIEDQHTVILFFGQVRRYKGLQRLIKAFHLTCDPNLKLVVAGKPYEDGLRKELEQAAKEDNRIMLYFGFIPEEEVAPLHALAQLVAIPFERTLTSGSVILAMSLGKALLLPDSARMLDVIDDRGALFFKTDDDLTIALEKVNSLDIEAMGTNNLRAAELFDWKNIGKRSAALYCDR